MVLPLPFDKAICITIRWCSYIRKQMMRVFIVLLISCYIACPWQSFSYSYHVHCVKKIHKTTGHNL